MPLLFQRDRVQAEVHAPTFQIDLRFLGPFRRSSIYSILGASRSLGGPRNSKHASIARPHKLLICEAGLLGTDSIRILEGNAALSPLHPSQAYPGPA